MSVMRGDIEEELIARRSSTDELIDLWLILLEMSAEDKLMAGSQSAQLRRFSSAIAKPGLIDRIVDSESACAARVAAHRAARR